MSDASPIRAILLRRRVIADEVENLHAQLRVLEQEDADLETTTRTLQKLGVVDATPPESVARGSLLTLYNNGGKEPTITTKVLWVCHELLSTSDAGVTRNEISNDVRRRWPTISKDVVRQTLWRLARDKHLVQDGEYYLRPQDANEYGVSHTGDAAQ